MSTLNVDTINDAAGTGAPSFPNGIELTGTAVSGPNKIQRKNLAANLTGAAANTNIFTFNNLVTGKVYTFYYSALVNFPSTTTDTFCSLTVVHNSVTLSTKEPTRDDAADGTAKFNFSDVVTFTAAASTIVLTGSGFGSTTIVEGNANYKTSATLIEQNNSVISTDFT